MKLFLALAFPRAVFLVISNHILQGVSASLPVLVAAGAESAAGGTTLGTAMSVVKKYLRALKMVWKVAPWMVLRFTVYLELLSVGINVSFALALTQLKVPSLTLAELIGTVTAPVVAAFARTKDLLLAFWAVMSFLAIALYANPFSEGGQFRPGGLALGWASGLMIGIRVIVTGRLIRRTRRIIGEQSREIADYIRILVLVLSGLSIIVVWALTAKGGLHDVRLLVIVPSLALLLAAAGIFNSAFPQLIENFALSKGMSDTNVAYMAIVVPFVAEFWAFVRSGSFELQTWLWMLVALVCAFQVLRRTA